MEREAPPGLPEEREQGREKVYSKRKTAQSSGDSEQRQSGTQPQKRRRKPTAERSLPREESAAALPRCGCRVVRVVQTLGLQYGTSLGGAVCRKVVPPIEGAKIPPDPASPQRHAAGPKGPAMRLKSNPSLTGTLVRAQLCHVRGFVIGVSAVLHSHCFVSSRATAGLASGRPSCVRGIWRFSSRSCWHALHVTTLPCAMLLGP